jgi:hypothetical protein
MKYNTNELGTVENLPSVIKSLSINSNQNDIKKLSKRLVTSFQIDRNQILSKLVQIPAIASVLQFEKGYSVIIPDKFKEELRNGTLRIMEGKDGSIISTIVDKAGHTKHQLRMNEFTKMANPVELTNLFNQMCIKIQLEEIQKTITDFRFEMNRKVDLILKILHDERIIKAETVAETFGRYIGKKNEITKKDIFLQIDIAVPTLKKEITSQIEYINKLKTNINKLTNSEIDEIQEKLCFILEALKSLQNVYLIEAYLNRNDKNAIKQINITYASFFSSVFTGDNIHMLQGFTNFDLLGLQKDIWYDEIKRLATSCDDKITIINKFDKKRVAR